MQQNIIVVDNFYSNIDKVRKYALTLNYSVKSNFPGARTKESFKSDAVKEHFEKIIGKKIHWNSDDKSNDCTGCYHLTTSGMPCQIHRDSTDWKFGADIIDSVGNVYNRLVIFKGRRSHSTMNHFGKDINDGRLFQVFFFNDSFHFVIFI